MSRFVVNKSRQYIYTLMKQMAKKQKLTVSEIDAMGGRWGGKTADHLIGHSDMLIHPSFEVGIYLWRASTSDATELFEEMLNYMPQEIKNECYINQTKRTIKIGKSFIKVSGMNSMKANNRAVKTGVASAQNVDYIVVHLEEAFEFEPHQVNSILESIRGGKQLIDTLVIKTSNPWDIANTYVSMLNKKVRFSKKVLSTTGDQFNFYKEERRIVHYTNWRVNPDFMSEDRHKLIKLTWDTDPKRARTTDLGMPGSGQGLIYSHSLEKMQPIANLPKETYTVIGGIDVGWGETKDSGLTTCVLGGVYNDGLSWDIHSEWTHSNEKKQTTENGVAQYTSFLDPDHMAKMLVLWIREQIKKYYINFRDSIIIKVDSANVAFISLLNQFGRALMPNKLYFEKTTKPPISDRVKFVQTALSSGDLRISRSTCKSLLQELALSYEIETTSKVKAKEVKRAKEYDHSINALEYMLSDYQYGYMDLGIRKML